VLKNSKAKTSKKRSAEIRAQISMAMTGKKHSDELFFQKSARRRLKQQLKSYKD